MSRAQSISPSRRLPGRSPTPSTFSELRQRNPLRRATSGGLGSRRLVPRSGGSTIVRQSSRRAATRVTGRTLARSATRVGAGAVARRGLARAVPYLGTALLVWDAIDLANQFFGPYGQDNREDFFIENPRAVPADIGQDTERYRLEIDFTRQEQGPNPGPVIDDFLSRDVTGAIGFVRTFEIQDPPGRIRTGIRANVGPNDFVLPLQGSDFPAPSFVEYKIKNIRVFPLTTTEPPYIQNDVAVYTESGAGIVPPPGGGLTALPVPPERPEDGGSPPGQCEQIEECVSAVMPEECDLDGLLQQIFSAYPPQLVNEAIQAVARTEDDVETILEDLQDEFSNQADLSVCGEEPLTETAMGNGFSGLAELIGLVQQKLESMHIGVCEADSALVGTPERFFTRKSKVLAQGLLRMLETNLPAGVKARTRDYILPNLNFEQTDNFPSWTRGDYKATLFSEDGPKIIVFADSQASAESVVQDLAARCSGFDNPTLVTEHIPGSTSNQALLVPYLVQLFEGTAGRAGLPVETKRFLEPGHRRSQ